VSLTARDCFQVCGTGGPVQFSVSPRRTPLWKAHRDEGIRNLPACRQLMPTAWRERPDLAVSHGSRSQLISAKLAGIPTVVICDYEFAESVPGAAPTWVMVPEVIPDTSVKFGNRRMLKYPGIKEDAYVPGFQPDPRILAELGMEGGRHCRDLAATRQRGPLPESGKRDRLLDATIDLLARLPETKIVFTAAQ